MTHALPIRIYYEDTDAGGIVFYGNYLKFAERGRTEWLRELGVNQEKLRVETGIFFVVRHCSISYHAPAKLDDVIEVYSHLRQLGNASIAFGQNVMRQGDGALLAEMEVTVVCVNAQMKATRVPQSIRDLLTQATETNNNN